MSKDSKKYNRILLVETLSSDARIQKIFDDLCSNLEDSDSRKRNFARRMVVFGSYGMFDSDLPISSTNRLDDEI